MSDEDAWAITALMTDLRRIGSGMMELSRAKRCYETLLEMVEAEGWEVEFMLVMADMIEFRRNIAAEYDPGYRWCGAQ